MNFSPKRFNPRAPRGARRTALTSLDAKAAFQSTRPTRGATSIPSAWAARIWFQSTRPTRGATMAEGRTAGAGAVSIHAPHAGRDRAGRRHRCTLCCFNPRAPRGARRGRDGMRKIEQVFQSTRPTRGATPFDDLRGFDERFQSTRPTRGATLGFSRPVAPEAVSIHAPHAGRDVPGFIDEFLEYGFQSTRPTRGATGNRNSLPPILLVSIHAPHAGRDWDSYDLDRLIEVSIHAPHAGRDHATQRHHPSGNGFNPRAPRGARPVILI